MTIARIAPLLGALTLCGGAKMSADGDKLFQLLGKEELQTDQTEQEIPAFSDAAKDEVVSRVLSTSPLDARRFAGLELIRTSGNAASLTAAWLKNVTAANPTVRHASLGALARSKNPQATAAAMTAASDDDDRVAALACGLLVQQKGDAKVRDRLSEVMGTRQGDAKFAMTTAILKSAGISPSISVAARDGGQGDGG
jgi:hypothetical protein